MIYKLLGKRIRLERFKKNWTQEKLAEMADISPAYMGQIERGERSIPLDTLSRIVNILGVSYDYLLQDSLIEKDSTSKEKLETIILSRTEDEQQIALDMIRLMYSHLDRNKADD